MRMQINRWNLTGLPFVYTCLGCKEQHTSLTGYCADLDGPAFAAYYCVPCGSSLNIQHDRTKGANHG